MWDCRLKTGIGLTLCVKQGANGRFKLVKELSFVE